MDIEKNKTFSIDTTGRDSLLIDSIPAPISDTSSNNEMNFNQNNSILNPLFNKMVINKDFVVFQYFGRKEE